MIRLGPLALLCCILPSGWFYLVDFSCPLNFRDREENIVSCKINKTAVSSAQCVQVQPYVTFERTVGDNSFLLCSTPSLNPLNCSHVLKPVSNTCWCNATDGEIYDYKFAYPGNRSRDQGTLLECKICLSLEILQGNEISPSCRNMSFANPGTDGLTNHHIIIGASIGAVLLAILVVTIAVIIMLRKHKRSKDYLSASTAMH